MIEELNKIDLHIHTPASKCYKGAKTDEEYIEILKKVREMNIDMIAITDHNTIAGYEKLMEIKQQLKNKLSVLEEFVGSGTKVNQAVNEFNCRMELFDKIKIFPGVEITLNPGIHIIVLAEHESKEELSELLDSIGYTEDKRGNDSDYSINTDVKRFLTNLLLNDKLVIAPHVDSDKGIYNDLTGPYRAGIFKSPIIQAMTCNNIIQQQNIKNLFLNEPLYKRDKKMAFINASDAHSTNEIGRKISYVKLSNKSLQGLKLAFSNPDANISDFNDQSIKNLIEKKIKNDRVFILQDINGGEDMYLSRYLCACLNQGYNYLLLGVREKDFELIGVKRETENLMEYIHNSIDKIGSKFQQLKYDITIETMGNGRNIAIIYLNPEVNSLWYALESNEVFIWDNEIRVASIYEIEELVKSNTLLELSKLEYKNNQSINSMVVKLHSLKNTIDKFNILQEIDLNSVPLVAVVSIQPIEAYKEGAKFKDNYCTNNGKDSGNVYYVEKCEVRLKEGVLRYSCPVTSVAEDEIDHFPTFKGSKIVISQGGGVFCIEKTEGRIVGVFDDFLLLEIMDDALTDYSIYSIVGWLKSSALIWYALKKINTTNLYLPDVMKRITIPILDCLKPGNVVENIVIDIINLEKEFLAKFDSKKICEDCPKCEEADCLMEKIVKRHNDEILQYTKQIDKIIFEELEINTDYQKLISSDLTAASIFNILDL